MFSESMQKKECPMGLYKVPICKEEKLKNETRQGLSGEEWCMCSVMKSKTGCFWMRGLFKGIKLYLIKTKLFFYMNKTNFADLRAASDNQTGKT